MEKAPSLAVPSVQEMVKKNPLQVPYRFLRSQQEIEKVNYMPHLSSEIPIIDLAQLSYGNTEELVKFDIACKEWGFFQIVNHGVPLEVMQKMKDGADEFFKLPIEEKNKYAMNSKDKQGYGISYVVSEEQSLDWIDSLMLIINPSNERKLQFWPKTPHGFKETIDAYSSEIKRVGEEVINSLSVIMGLVDKHALLGLHKELRQFFRLNYYPPCSTPEKVLGLSPHSDMSTITLLMQSDDVPGLEIRHKGSWVPVTPVQNALVVNVGDLIQQIWSNGKYKSVEHRAVTNKSKRRISLGIFLNPQSDVEVEPFDHMIDAQNPKLYQKITFGDYLRQTSKIKLEGKTHVDVARIKEHTVEEKQI